MTAARKHAKKRATLPAGDELTLPTLSLGRRLDKLKPEQFQFVLDVVSLLERPERAADNASEAPRGKLLILEGDGQLDRIHDRLSVFGKLLSECGDLDDHQISAIGDMVSESACDVFELYCDGGQWSDFLRLLNSPEAQLGLIRAIPDAISARSEREAVETAKAS